jgi:hypothetical protein
MKTAAWARYERRRDICIRYERLLFPQQYKERPKVEIYVLAGRGFYHWSTAALEYLFPLVEAAVMGGGPYRAEYGYRRSLLWHLAARMSPATPMEHTT